MSNPVIADLLQISREEAEQVCQEAEFCGFIYRNSDYHPWQLTLKGYLIRWIYGRQYEKP